MVTAEERMKILHMLQEGKLTPEAAAQLLQALEAEPASVRPAVPAAPAAAAYAASPYRPGYEEQVPLPSAETRSAAPARWLRVRVTDTDTGRPRVNVRVPIGLVNMGMKLGARYAPEIEGVDLAAILQAVQTGDQGSFVDVYDEEDGEHVEVFLE